MIVVTGGAGFIGSNIIHALAAEGRGPISVIDRLESSEKWTNLRSVELDELVDPDDTFDFLEYRADEIDYVIHMGAISATTETDADLIIETNYRLPQRIWAWCANNGIPLIYASSAATYGDGAHGFDDDATPEALARLQPLNAYGWSKHLFDRWVVRQVADGAETPPQWVGLKFFNVYGPREWHKGSMMSGVTRAYPGAARGEPVTLFRSHHPDYPDGGQKRDFVYVLDCVDVVLWLMDRPDVSGLFNLGTGHAESWLELMEALYAALGHEMDVCWVDTPEEIREKYQYFTEADMSGLRAAGYDRPFRSVADGVADYVRRYPNGR